MEKEYKPTELDWAVHRSFNNIMELFKNGKMLVVTHLDDYLETVWKEDPLLVPKIKDVLITKGLIYKDQGNSLYTLGDLGILLRDGEERYLGHQRIEHERRWQELQNQIREQKYLENEDKANISSIETNETVATSSRTSMRVAVVTAAVLIIQIGYQIWQDITKDRFEDQLKREFRLRERIIKDSIKNELLNQKQTTDTNSCKIPPKK